MEQPHTGAEPPLLFTRWLNVVLLKIWPPSGPGSDPIVWSKRQSIAPAFGQLASVPAWTKFAFCAQTLLLSRELCHVASPKRGGFGPTSFGFSTGLRKWVMIWNAAPKTFVKSVASGRALLTVQEAPEAVGKQTYP